ncbi:MAG: L,D-transpeptidase family protein [Rhodospirillales bacterium]|nr:L,D-transpeptidase family protein [Rhodospirillales bacterium]
MHIKVYANNILEFQARHFRCALGRSGVSEDKHEGDGATPIGVFALKRLLVRTDRIASVSSMLLTQAISPDDGWCDDPAHTQYNRLVKLPFDASHEQLWRDDAVYDLVIEISHNDDPPVPGAGSAVFIHVAQADYAPTAGCVALARDDLLQLLPHWSNDTFIEITDSEYTP